MAKAQFVYYFKDYLNDKRYVLEQKIYKVENLEKFPDGIKYSLVLYDRKSNDKVLMDNHHPKSHHVHVGNKEFEYQFTSEPKLMQDFKKFVYQYMGVKL